MPAGLRYPYNGNRRRILDFSGDLDASQRSRGITLPLPRSQMSVLLPATDAAGSLDQFGELEHILGLGELTPKVVGIFSQLVE